MPCRFRIRRARASDSDACAEVIMLVRARMAYLPQDVHSPDETRAWMRDVVLADENVWVAEVDDEVVAYGSVGNGYLNHLYVHPQHQGRGVGSALLNQAKAQAWEGLKLWTFEPNQGAYGSMKLMASSHARPPMAETMKKAYPTDSWPGAHSRRLRAVMRNVEKAKKISATKAAPLLA